MRQPRLLVGIVSCEAHRYTHDAIRRTWVTQKGFLADHRFFMGKGANARDEVDLKCDDTYRGLTEKALKTFEWTLKEGYEYILHVGRDTYVSVPRVVAADLWGKDYAGNGGGSHGYKGGWAGSEPDGHGYFSYASGGAGSWLSAKAMRLVLDSKLRHVADDLMFGWILGTHGILLWDDPRFCKSGGWLEWDQITMHLSRGTGNYKPEWMFRAHKHEVLNAGRDQTKR